MLPANEDEKRPIPKTHAPKTATFRQPNLVISVVVMGPMTKQSPNPIEPIQAEENEEKEQVRMPVTYCFPINHTFCQRKKRQRRCYTRQFFVQFISQRLKP